MFNFGGEIFPTICFCSFNRFFVLPSKGDVRVFTLTWFVFSKFPKFWPYDGEIYIPPWGVFEFPLALFLGQAISRALFSAFKNLSNFSSMVVADQILAFEKFFRPSSSSFFNRTQSPFLKYQSSEFKLLFLKLGQLLIVKVILNGQ